MELAINDIVAASVTRAAHVETFDNEFNSPIEYKCDILTINITTSAGENIDIIGYSPEHKHIDLKLRI